MEINKILKQMAWQASLLLSIAMLVVLVCQHFGYDASIYFMGIGALVTLSTDKKLGIRSGIERLIGCISGGICGLITLMLCHLINFDFIIPIIMFPLVYILILFNGRVKNKTGTLEAIVVFVTLLTMVNSDTNIYLYTLHRFIDTLIGFGLGIMINKFIYRNY